MVHYPSVLSSKTAPGFQLSRHKENLNATQQKANSPQILSKVEEELHDARRVLSDGQEEDLKLALDMVIGRLSEISLVLSDVYKTQAELEIQLNVAKSNLQLVISNNEMLEEALRRDSVDGNVKDVGWRRASARETREINPPERQSISEHSPPPSAADSPPTSANGRATPSHSPITSQSTTTTSVTQEASRFFRFRFTTSRAASPISWSRPVTPGPHQNDPRNNPGSNVNHLTSPSLPVLPSAGGKGREMGKETEDELKLEREKRKKMEKEKTALEAELESLSQALFEEANKMVVTERIKCAETEEELKEVKLEKEALRCALQVLEMENEQLRARASILSTSVTASVSEPSHLHHHRRTSSQLALKSVPGSPVISPLSSPHTEISPEEPGDVPPISPVFGNPQIELREDTLTIRSRSSSLLIEASIPLPFEDSESHWRT